MADSRVSVLLDFNSRLAGANQALAAMRNLAGTLAGAATAYLSFRTAIRGGRDIVELGAKLQHLNQQTGIGVRSLSVMGQAFEDAGVSADKVRTSVSIMQKQIVDGARGTGEGLVAFSQLALDARDLLELSPEDQFQRIGDAIARIEDPAIRANAAMKIFGEAGAELQGVFAGGFEDAELSLGRLPELMERNSVALERIDTLIGRTRNKTRQFFAGFLDQTESHIRTPLEALDKIDFTGIGQKLGAFAGIAIDAWNDGNFPQFMALSIEAGIEKGVDSAKNIFEDLVGIVSGAGFWANLTNLIASFGVSIGKAFITAMSEVTALFDATLTWMIEQLPRLATEFRIQSERLKVLLGGDERALAAFDSAADAVRTMADKGREFVVVWDESRRTFNATAKAGTDYLDEQLRQTREILGVNTENNANNISAAERLNQLIQQRIDKRNAEGGAGAGVPGIGGNNEPPVGNRALDPYSWSDQLAAGLNSLPTLAQSAGDAVRTSLGGAVSSIATGLDGLFQRSMTLSQALSNMARGFGQAITQAISQMLANMTVSFAIMAAKYAVAKGQMFALDVLYAGKALALNLANAAKSLVSWIPSAIAASIASYGTAAAVGLAAVVAGLAAFGAFEQGGYTGDGPSNAIAGAVHRGEFVFSAPAVNRIGLSTLNAAHNSALGGFRSSGGSGFGGSNNEQPIVVNIANVHDEREGMRWLESREGRKILYRGLRNGQGIDGWGPS